MISTTRKQKTSSATFDIPSRFINRELSWLDFNGRVLDEAGMSGNMILDRLKFISIFSSNLDEFFMVRVAGLRQLLKAGIIETDPAGYTPAEQLQLTRKKISVLLKQQYSQLYSELLPELEKEKIILHNFPELPEKIRHKLCRHFETEIMPALTPLAVDPSHPFPLLNSGTIELALKLHFPKSGKYITAFVEVPELLGRFIRICDEKSEVQEFILIEELIAANIPALFPGGEVRAIQLFRVTRDMDYHIDQDESGDLLKALRSKLSQRSSRAPVLLEFSKKYCDRSLQKYLADALDLEPDFCYTLPGALRLEQFNQLIDLVDRENLQEPPWHPTTPEIFSGKRPVFEAINEKKNILLAHPYQSFDPVLKLLEDAADDPSVLAIKQTLYRVSGNSPVIKALRRAAENGKQVTVVVELKARFDESNNIAWAELLDLSGAHVVYGVTGLKVHCKTLLIVRKEDKKLRRYIHLGTGNYNDNTARLYTDLSLLSCDEELAGDAAILFNLLTGAAEPPEKWEKLCTAPFDLRSKLVEMIKKETALGKKGRIIAKMNSFSDPELITLIHEAAAEGVEIDLIVRGICCCRPLPGQKNLRIISIIDRFLEHSRIFCFGSEENIYCSSADWMPRNLDRRVETMFPVSDPENKRLLMEILCRHLQDYSKQRRLLASGNYTRPAGNFNKQCRSQLKIYEFFKNQVSFSIKRQGG